MAKVKVWVEVCRHDGIETRGVEGTPEEVREMLAHYSRQYGVHRVLDERGQDVTEHYRLDAEHAEEL